MAKRPSVTPGARTAFLSDSFRKQQPSEDNAGAQLAALPLSPAPLPPLELADNQWTAESFPVRGSCVVPVFVKEEGGDTSPGTEHIRVAKPGLSACIRDGAPGGDETSFPVGAK